jgi:hypothetical protein
LTVSFAVDLERGGRWTDLTLAGRQWLWRRDDPARAQVGPGTPFVDAGGLEECMPTIRGVPDHGAIWNRPWTDLGDDRSFVETEDFWLGRVIRGDDETVTATYRLEAESGYRFVWAAHALLDLSEDAVVQLPEGLPVRMYDQQVAGSDGRGWVESSWPECAGVPMSRLGPVDGTATGAVVVGASRATVLDRGRALDLVVTCAGAHVSVAVWRNLGGFPADRPYRSIGIEPMLGAVFDLDEARVPGDVACVPGSGELTWELTLRGRRIE